MIGVLVIATGIYKQFLPDLVRDIKQHMPQGTTLNLFTDDKDIVDWDLSTMIFEIPHEGFPGATLHRYKFFIQYEPWIVGDHLLFTDVDMSIVKDVGEEFCIDGIFAVAHAGFRVREGTWEERPESTAYSSAPRLIYCAGGVQGGEREAYLDACRTLAANILTDDNNGVLAVWHDESHWNRYVSEHAVTILPPIYCWPDEQPSTEAKIRCLNKGLEWTSRAFPT